MNFHNKPRPFHSSQAINNKNKFLKIKTKRNKFSLQYFTLINLKMGNQQSGAIPRERHKSGSQDLIIPGSPLRGNFCN